MARLLRLGVITGLLAALLAGCGDGNETTEGDDATLTRSLEEIKASGKLVVLTRNAPTTWYIDRDGEPTGPEYDLVQHFASALGVEVEFLVKDTVEEILRGVESGEGDFAAAGLTAIEARSDRFLLGPSYQQVRQQVVCRRDGARPDSIEELVGLDLAVIADSSYSAQLQALQNSEYPQLSWQETADKDTEQLLYDVWQRDLDCTVADSNIVDINRRYMPELVTPLNLTEPQALSWVFPLTAHDLKNAVKDWLSDFRNSDGLAAWRNHYYDFFSAFDYVDVRTLIRRLDNRFPKYQGLFEAAAQQYDVPFLTLVAQGYQESHWNPRAVSPTGVRGIMMLTRNTARAMGVDNRMDPEQSIMGGAKYLARMRERFTDEVTEPDRTWLALAAYNVGRAHLHDAQKLARKKGLSPHHWKDMREVLPLLAQKKYYKDLKYGYARGHEPVRYVQRIREYEHIIANHLRDGGN